MKKEIPLHLIKIVEKFIHDNSDIITNHVEDNCIYCLRDKDPNSNFYYKILKQVPKHVQLTSVRDVIIEKRPQNEFKIEANFAGITYDKLQPTLSK